MGWVALSIVSGLCAALNGLFAKLVTTQLTTSIAAGTAAFLGLREGDRWYWTVEVGVRGVSLALNLLFNGIMWALFTAALTSGSSTTKVSVINTSSNFILTALLGSLIFSEKLPGIWWAGASLLVAGNVIIGRRDDEENEKKGFEQQPADYQSQKAGHNEAISSPVNEQESGTEGVGNTTRTCSSQEREGLLKRM